MQHLLLIAFTATIISTTLEELRLEKVEADNLKLNWKHSQKLQDSVISGKAVFITHCSNCHKDTMSALAPAPAVLSLMTSRVVLASLESGKMRAEGSKLSDGERKAVAQWITNSSLKSTSFPKEVFTSFSLPAGKSAAFDHSGWGNNLEGAGFRTSAQAGISPANVSTLELKWAFAFPEATIVRSKPAVVGDWLIVGGQFGDVFAINKYTGKPGWSFNASAAIRGAIAITKEGNAITAFFADYSTNVYAVDVRTGKLIWYKRAGFDPQSSVTGSVAVYGGRVYIPITSLEVGSAANGKYACCVSSGGVVALDARTGKTSWIYRILPKASLSGKNRQGNPTYGPSGAPVWCSPTVDAKRGLLYIGTGENYSLPTTTTSDAIQALDLKTGKVIWSYQATENDAYNVACPFFANCPTKPGPDFDFGMAPMLIKRKDGKDILVAGQKSGVVYAFAADGGKLLWKTKIGKGGALGGIHWGMATDGQNVYAANADNLVGIDRTDTSFALSPGIYSLDLLTGKVAWKTPTPGCPDKKNCIVANSAAPVVIPGIVFAGATDGNIRAYSTADGKILWEFDTAKEYDTSVGIKGKGGSIDGPAPVVSDGMLFVNSGYGMFGQKSGNVLLAFAIKK